MTPTHIIKSDNQQIGDLEVSYPAYVEKTCILEQSGELIELTESMLQKFLKIMNETNRCKKLYSLMESDMAQPGQINDDIA
jgi:hypothetical protein